MSLYQQFEQQIKQLPPEVCQQECALIELGRESARRFDSGHDPAGSRVQRVLADLRKLIERRERLTLPAPAPEPPQRSELDEIRARRAQRGTGPA